MTDNRLLITMKKIIILAVVGATVGWGASFSLQAQSVVNFENSLINNTNLGFITTSVGGADPFILVDGMSNGDSGNWGLEGSNGPKLIGFYGSWVGMNQGYTGSGDTTNLAINFTVPTTTTPNTVDVSFDLLQRNGGTGSYTFYGFNNGSLVSTINPAFSSVTINGYNEQMATLNFSGIDQIRFNSTSPGGLDNFVIASAVPEPTTLALAGLGGLSWLFIRRRKPAPVF